MSETKLGVHLSLHPLRSKKARTFEPDCKHKKNSANAEFKHGANDRARTDDNRYHKPGLYQLSYVRHRSELNTDYKQ